MKNARELVKEKEQREAREFLLTFLKPNSTIYTACFRVAESGMSRNIGVYAVKDSEIICLDFYVEKLCGYMRAENDNGVKVSGCGMDMGFAIVYDLGSKLWPIGTPKPHGTRNGNPDSDGGYALKHKWM